MSATIISIANQAGGTGKTTTAQNLACVLGIKFNRVLLVDMNAKCDLTHASGIVDDHLSILDVFLKDFTIEDVLVHCKYYDIVPSEYKLQEYNCDGNWDDILCKALDNVRKIYDYIIIDTPSMASLPLIASLCVSDYVISPIFSNIFSCDGVHDLLKTMDKISKYNSKLTFLGVLLSKYNDRQLLDRYIYGYSTEHFDYTFDTCIRNSISIPESQYFKEPLIDYNNYCKAISDYYRFADELLKRIKNIESNDENNSITNNYLEKESITLELPSYLIEQYNSLKEYKVTPLSTYIENLMKADLKV